MNFPRQERIFDIEEKWRQKIIKHAHEDAYYFLRAQVDGFMEGTADKTKAYESYQSSFMDSLIKHYYSYSNLVRRSFKVTFKPLLERLSEKGTTGYKVETDPLTLTVFLKNGSMTFTDSDQGLFVGVNDYKVKVSHWNEDMVDLLEIVLDECQESETIRKIDELLIEYKTEEIRNQILVTTVEGYVHKKLPSGSYKIRSCCITYFNDCFASTSPKFIKITFVVAQVSAGYRFNVFNTSNMRSAPKLIPTPLTPSIPKTPVKLS